MNILKFLNNIDFSDDDARQQQARGVQHSASAAAVPGVQDNRGKPGVCFLELQYDHDRLLQKFFRGPQSTEEITSPTTSPSPLRRSAGSQPTSAFHSTKSDWYDGPGGDYAEIRRECKWFVHQSQAKFTT